MNQAQFDKIQAGRGFIAALDQSGGSTPKALAQYGIEQDSYSTDEQMFDLMHQMRSRIIQAPEFTQERVVGAILFENTLQRSVDGVPTAQALWEKRGVVPFLKVDQGLQDRVNDAQLMKPITKLDDLLSKAKAAGVFGTKMRSVIWENNTQGINDVVAQQFEVAQEILKAGLMPIIEPELSIEARDKAQAEDVLLAALFKELDALGAEQTVMLKLTLPEAEGLYAPLIAHPKVLRVVALSGGYARDAANQRLAGNKGMIASFSRALTQDLHVSMTDDAFNAHIGKAINTIYDASAT